MNHKDSLTAQMRQVPGHDFNSVAVLHDPALLGELEKVVTMKPSAVIASPTGTPPHVETNKCLFIIITKLSDVLELQKGVPDIIKDTVTKTLEDRAVAAGQPTISSIKKLLNEKFADFSKVQKEGIQAIANAQNLLISDGDAGDLGFGDGGTDGTNGTNGNDSVQNKWAHKGAFRFVPPDFKFPSCKLEQGLVCWFKGMKLENAVIRPF